MKIARISWIFDIFTIVNSSHYRYLLIWIWIYPILEIKTPWNMDNQTTIWRKETVIILSFYLNVHSFMKLAIHWYTDISKLLTTKRIKNQGGRHCYEKYVIGLCSFFCYITSLPVVFVGWYWKQWMGGSSMTVTRGHAPKLVQMLLQNNPCLKGPSR